MILSGSRTLQEDNFEKGDEQYLLHVDQEDGPLDSWIERNGWPGELWISKTAKEPAVTRNQEQRD